MKNIFTIILLISHFVLFAQFGKDFHVDVHNNFGTGYVQITGLEIKCTADFNGDGFNDIIYPEDRLGYPILSLLKNNNGFNFMKPKVIYNYNISDGRYYLIKQIKAADFNNDNKMDFVIFFETSEVPTTLGKVSWFKNLGNDIFEENLISGISGWADNIEVVDIDHNGFVDVLTTYHALDALYNNIDKITIAKNTNGTFQVQNINGPHFSVATGDLDNDGYIDFITRSDANPIDSIYWFKNVGDTAYIRQQSIGSWRIINKNVIIDVDNDGLKDIIYADVPSTSSLYLTFYKIKNLGNGNFSTPVIISQNLIDGEVKSNWYIKDIDNDGLLDIDIVNANFSAYLKNLGGFTFGSTLTIFDIPKTYNAIYPTNQHYGDYVFDNFNNDTIRDLVILGYDSILYTTKIGNSYVIKDAFATHPNSFNLLNTIDIDNDNDDDIVCIGVYKHFPDRFNYISTSIFKYINNGNGTFSAPILLFDSAYSATILQSEKLNNDNTKDLIFYSPTKKQIFISYNNAGVFTLPTPIVSNINLDKFILADVDSDNDLDIIGYYNNEFYTMLNNGDGAFSTKNLIYADPISTTVGRSIVVDDLDIDGKNDIIYSSYNDNKIVLLKNTGNSFIASTLISNINKPTRFAIADFDGDSKKDFVINDNDNLFVLFNNNLNFTYKSILANYSFGINNGIIQTYDIDGDGDFDIIFNIDSNANGYVGGELGYIIYENDGMGNFNLRTTSHNANNIFSSSDMAISDIDKDGDLDFLSYKTREIKWTETKYKDRQTAKAIVFFDANSNGRFDAGEITLRNQRVTVIQGNVSRFTSSNGEIYFTNLYGRCNIQFTVPDNWILTTQSNTYIINVPTDTAINLYFGIKPSNNVTMYKPSVTASQARCNENSDFQIDVNNNGSITKRVKLEILHDETFQLISTSITPDSIFNGRIVYIINNLNPTYLKSFKLEFKIPEFYPLSSNLYPFLTKTYTFESNNQYVYNSKDSLAIQVRCAYDPNDKIASPVGVTPDKHYTLKNTQMEYTIRFQNVGNDTARNVIIVDSLSSWYGVWNYQSPFKIINSSHPISRFYIYNYSNLYIEFKGINLPDSSSNLKGSQGYVRFSVIPPPTIPDFTLVTNKAYITFDRNPPIVTNEVFNTFVTTIPAVLNVGLDKSICPGQSVTLTASGATSYIWSTGATTSSITVSPTITTTYIVTGIVNGISQKDTVIVFVNPTKTTNITRTICAGASYSFNGQSLTTAGTYRDTLQQTNGCDSFIVLTLQIIPTKTTNITQAICTGTSYSFNGQNLTTAGTYRDTLQQANGCDSFIVLTLQLNPTKTTNVAQAICTGTSYSFNGQNLTTAGTYRDTLQQANGCDSFIVLTLQINPTKTTNIIQAIQQGQTYNFNDQQLNSAGTYRDTLIQANGCDSIIILELTIATSLKNNISFVNNIKIFPNPSNEFVRLQLNAKKLADFNVSLITIDGSVLIAKNYTSTSNINEIIDLKNYSKGVYLLQIKSEQEQATYQIVKQ